MIREGVEDYNRWKSDKKDNSHLTLVYRGHEFEKCKWQDLKCGDFIKIMKD
jgi:magnesium-transporting ATPase (P-type)